MLLVRKAIIFRHIYIIENVCIQKDMGKLYMLLLFRREEEGKMRTLQYEYLQYFQSFIIFTLFALCYLNIIIYDILAYEIF